jgi:hypothetical protein
MQNDRELGRELGRDFDRQFDRMIDAALPGYSRAEPSPGLEERVLTRARAEQPRRRQRSWPWLLWIPAPACLLLFLFLTGLHRPARKGADAASLRVPPPRASGPELAATRPSPVPQPRGARSQPRIDLRTASSASESSLPKQAIFPSPSPLTAEERALIALSRASTPLPKQPEAATVNIEPIHIAELDIEPVVVPPLDPSESNPPATHDQQP